MDDLLNKRLFLKNPRDVRKEIVLSRLNIALGVFASTLVAVTPALAAPILPTVYSQPYTTTNAYQSDSNPSDLSAETNAEDFTLTASSLVRGVSWAGIVYGTGTPTTFTISFYTNSGGLPGSLIYTYDVTPSVTDLEVLTNSDETYSYNASLPDTLLYGSTEYWVSIVADGSTSTFGWATGTGPGDGFAYAYPPSPGFSLSSTTDDLSLTLFGSPAPTPEPSSLALLGTGILGMAGFARRRVLRS